MSVVKNFSWGCDVNKLSGALIIICCLISGGVQASSLLQVKNGKTIVRLTEAFQDALVDCDLERIKPTVIRGNGGLDLKVVGGALDPSELIGEVNHNGGLTLSCESIGSESVISVQNLTLDLLGESPVITALFTVDGTVEGRLPFLIPGGDQFSVQRSKGGGFIKLLNVDLTLHPEAASLLSDVFGIVVGEDIYIGRSWSRINLWKANGRDEEDKEDKEEKEDEDDDDEDDEDDEDEDDDDEEDEDDD